MTLSQCLHLIALNSPTLPLVGQELWDVLSSKSWVMLMLLVWAPSINIPWMVWKFMVLSCGHEIIQHLGLKLNLPWLFWGVYSRGGKAGSRDSVCGSIFPLQLLQRLSQVPIREALTGFRFFCSLHLLNATTQASWPRNCLSSLSRMRHSGSSGGGKALGCVSSWQAPGQTEDKPEAGAQRHSTVHNEWTHAPSEKRECKR